MVFLLTFPLDTELKGSYIIELENLNETDMIRLFYLSLYGYTLSHFFEWTKASDYQMEI